MEKYNRKLRIFKFNKKDMLEYAKHNMDLNQEFEIDYYSKSFKYNKESLDEIEKEISSWEGQGVLYRDLYYQKKIEEDTKILKDLTNDFILSDIKCDDDVLIYLSEVAKILEKYRTLFFGKIKPEYKKILKKLHDNGYKASDRANIELKKYNKDYEVMACIIDDDKKDLLSSILIQDSMDCFNRGFFDPKIYRGIDEYKKRFIKTDKKVKVKK